MVDGAEAITNGVASASIDAEVSSAAPPKPKVPTKPNKTKIQTPPRPKFKPTYLPREHASPLDTETDTWVTPLSAPAYFPLDVFHSILNELSRHPEQNSSLIIRADCLPSQPGDNDDGGLGERLGLEMNEHSRFRFVPRQPNRDSKLEQLIHTYNAPDGSAGLHVKMPQADCAANVPYYHPPVRKLAFQWHAAEETETAMPEEGVPRVYGTISVSYLAFKDTPVTGDPDLMAPPPKAPRRRSPLAPPLPEAAPVRPPATVLEDDSPEARIEAEAVIERRLNRTCLALLEKLHKHGYGTMIGYQKRVHHDVVVPREPFQDLYQTLKERHKRLDSRVPLAWSTKVEDVKRHVWKNPGSPDDRALPDDLSLWGSQDIAICTFLMLLWKDMYPPREGPAITGQEWDTWGRPPAGFVDLGCGNGLIVHILVSEGYDGKGYELRARRTWPEYPDKTQASLIELPINMPSWFPETLEQWEAGEWPGRQDCVIKEGSFMLGNHADELTPWIPLLSLIPAEPVPYLSLPCCLHTLDDKFMTLDYKAPPHTHTPECGFESGLEAGSSRYKSYVMWLGWVGLQCGWKWEKESLRIPSTRGWGIVARSRWTTTAEEDRACREWALNEVKGVRERETFKVRIKEGKEH